MTVHEKFPLDEMTIKPRIEDVVEGVACPDHNAKHGFPCHTIAQFSEDLNAWAICNKRARKFGMVGKISATSLGLVFTPQKRPL